MKRQRRDRGISPLHSLWLLIFLVDASLRNRGWDHRLGALLFLVFFGFLIAGELREPRDNGSRTCDNSDA